MKWTYYKDKMNDGGVVAKLYSRAGILVFVYKTDTGYCAIPSNQFLVRVDIMDADARKMCTKEEEELSAGDYLYCVMIHACEYFEQAIISQLEMIKDEVIKCLEKN